MRVPLSVDPSDLPSCGPAQKCHQLLGCTEPFQDVGACLRWDRVEEFCEVDFAACHFPVAILADGAVNACKGVLHERPRVPLGDSSVEFIWHLPQDPLRELLHDALQPYSPSHLRDSDLPRYERHPHMPPLQLSSILPDPHIASFSFFSPLK